MPRNNKEGILFSFVMSAIMIFVMAALNYYVRAALGMGEFSSTWAADAWARAVTSFPLAYLVGMVCDLGFCTPASRRIAAAVCEDGDRPGVRFFAGPTPGFWRRGACKPMGMVLPGSNCWFRGCLERKRCPGEPCAIRA